MKIIANPKSLCPGQMATLTASEFAGTPKNCSWTITSHSCECKSYPDSHSPLSIQVQALPEDLNGGTITVKAAAGNDSATEVFTVHGINITGKVTVSNGQKMDPGVAWGQRDKPHDCFCFGGNTIQGQGLKLSGEATIQLAGTCRRKDTCASNFELGFLQSTIHQERVVEYEHGLWVTKARGQVDNGSAPNLPLALRDAASTKSVFYDDNERRSFTGDNDKQTVQFFDNPGMLRDIMLNDLGKLKAARMDIRFQTWLAVRNVAWYEVEKDASMIFICNFLWSASGDWRWDGKTVGCLESKIEVEHIMPGKGARDPILSGPVVNDLIRDKKQRKVE